MSSKNDNNENQFQHLSAESDVDRYAQMNSEERSQFDEWIDMCAALPVEHPAQPHEVKTFQSKLP